MALTGTAFRLLESKKLQNLVMFKAIIAKCQVYARMSPEEKMLLVNCLQMDDQKVAMCGDGSNDCEALKAADIGVSLGQAEASIAAPFTSKSESIECCLTVLKEGKASVATMIQSFKATEIYSMIQLFQCCFLFTIGVFPSQGQFIYVDLFASFVLTLFAARTPAVKKLTSETPPKTLFHAPIIVSLLVATAIQFVF